MTMNSNIDEVLTALGWQDGFRIPVANEENKQLEEEVMQFIRVMLVSFIHARQFFTLRTSFFFLSSKLLHSSMRKFIL